MQSGQPKILASLCCIGLLTTATLNTALAAEPKKQTSQSEQTTKQPTSQSPVPTAQPGTQKPATLRGKAQRNREADVFEPTEQISEDFAAPMPVDI
tara:strand:+ start:113 stop:400 length:288 start_codon:yes stop_codon:yes gene_type:complete